MYSALLFFVHPASTALLYCYTPSSKPPLSCSCEETPEHLLLCCSIWKQLRELLKKKLNIEQLNMKFLFNTQLGLKFLVEFLSQSKVATRTWLIEGVS